MELLCKAMLYAAEKIARENGYILVAQEKRFADKDKFWGNVAAAVGMELLRKAAERINPIALPSGGIVVPPPPKVGVAQMPTGEMVLNREQVERIIKIKEL